jgi:hypothetical protein
MTVERRAKVLRRIGAYAVAVAFMTVLGTAAHSLLVQRAWSRAAGEADGTGPAAIAFDDRMAWFAHDLAGLFVGYTLITGIALLIAFLAAGALARFSGGRTLVFGLAGASSIWVLFTTLRIVLGTVGIFGARGPMGLAAQMAVGAMAGSLFARLTRKL